MNETTLISLTAISILSVTCQWIAWKSRVPAILFLLLAGILGEPICGCLDPEPLFGDLLYPLISLAVAIILFEGGLTLKLSDIQGLGRAVRNLLTTGLSSVFGAYTLANLIMAESGLLAVTVMGMRLANMKHIHLDDILHFKEHLTVFLISGLFVILAARFKFTQFETLGWSAIAVLAGIQLIARSISVLISTIDSTCVRYREKTKGLYDGQRVASSVRMANRQFDSRTHAKQKFRTRR